MRVLIINSVCGILSTGKICAEQAEKLIADGHEVKIAYGREAIPEKYRAIAIRIGNKKNVYFNALKSRMLDNEGFNCKRTTKKFLQWADHFDPDLLLLHNLHGYYLNIALLFDWIKKRKNMRVKWTLHDCWAFTGHCSYFSYARCDKWKDGCYDCPQKKSYPNSWFVDNCKINYEKKRNIMSDVERMSITVPSHWLKKLVEQSFLKRYPIEVMHNTIDLETFKPTKSDFKKQYGLNGKIVLLGVAAVWDDRKGLSDFQQMAEKISDSFSIVLVGLTAEQKRKIGPMSRFSTS